MGAVGAVGAGLAALAGHAQATWSIIIIDTRTREIAVASATCLTGFDLQAETPILVPRVGAGTAQSFVEPTGLNLTFIRDSLVAGLTPDQILAGLASRDPGHQTRQYGIVDAEGRTLTFSGTGAGPWAGGETGRLGDLVYAVQGNVLTGEVVVRASVDAILNTPGGLADKLMASMEAARAMGGDGRCSCHAPRADGCGAPPPAFTKSAHIAYMLIARDGDDNACQAVYRVGNQTQSVTTADVNADGKPDLLASAAGAMGVAINISPVGGPPVFSDPVVLPIASTLRDVAVADFDADGRPDVAVADLAAGSVRLFATRADGTLEPGPVWPMAAQASALLAADLNSDGRPDLAAACVAADVVAIRFNAGGGVFGPVVALATGDGPNLLALADADSDRDPDLLVSHVGDRRAVLLRNDGAGAFTQERQFTAVTAPTAIAYADLNDDGLADIVTTTTSETSVRVLIRNTGGTYAVSSLPLGTSAGPVVVRDFDGDGKADLLAVGRATRAMGFIRGAGDGTFEAVRWSTVGRLAGRLADADLDGDGDIDLAMTIPANGTIMATANLAGPGVIPQFGDRGCAAGAYYMEFNVANTVAADPDPVFTLADQFAAWSAGLAGVPDAVRSAATLEIERLPSDGVRTAELVIELRDRAGAVIHHPRHVSLEQTAGPGVGLGPVRALGGGRYAASVRAGAACGEAELIVRVAHEPRDVILMPRTIVTLGPPGDFNADGFVDWFDLLAFWEAYDAEAPEADLTGDGHVDDADAERMIRLFHRSC